jgi:hypothetical protein
VHPEFPRDLDGWRLELDLRAIDDAFELHDPAVLEGLGGLDGERAPRRAQHAAGIQPFG